MFIRDDGKGTLLTDVREFCTSEATSKQECVTSLKRGGPDCVSLQSLFLLIGVENDDCKTCVRGMGIHFLYSHNQST